MIQIFHIFFVNPIDFLCIFMPEKMEKQPLTYDFPAVKTPALAFNGIGIIQFFLGGGNSLIINELDQKPGNFTEYFTEDLIEYSGGTKALNAFNDINALSAAAFLFSCNIKPNNKQSLTNLNLTIQKMKKTTKLKAIVLAMTMLAGMFVPTSAFAQNDDFFRSTDDVNNGFARDVAAWNLTNQTFGEAPIGSGLLILTAFGAGYVALKKKEERQ